MFHEDTADRRKGNVITSGPQFCALRISALDRSKSRGQHGRSVSVTGPIDRIHRRYALGQDEHPVCNVVAKIFMPAGHSCVIEFEHISAAFASTSPFRARSVSLSCPLSLSLSFFLCGNLYRNFRSSRETQTEKTGRTLSDSYFDIGQ